jgi:hypothetical protein
MGVSDLKSFSLLAPLMIWVVLHYVDRSLGGRHSNLKFYRDKSEHGGNCPVLSSSLDLSRSACP